MARILEDGLLQPICAIFCYLFGSWT